jgi:hypothetical protein
MYFRVSCTVVRLENQDFYFKTSKRLKMTIGQTLIVLEVDKGVTTDEVNQVYKKRVLKWYTFLVDVLTITMSRLLILLHSVDNFPSLIVFSG